MGPCDHRTAPLVPRRPATRVCECRSGTHVPAIRPTRSGRATRRRALAREVGGAWDARPTRDLSPRCAGAGVAGVVLCLRIGCLSSAALQVQHARRRLFLLPSRGAASTATGEEARSRTRAGAARRTCGWFSPPHSSRMSRAVVLLFFFCRRSSSLSPAFSLVVASCGAGPRQRASRRATRARCARRACVTGGSRRRSRARMSRVWCSLLLSSSLVLSRRARRSLDPPARRRGGAHHERARGARDARRDAHGAWGIRAPSALGARGLCFARRLVARFCLCCPVAPFRARLSLAPPRAGGVRTTRGRAVHVAHGATRAARGESERRAPSELAVRVRGNGRPGLPWGFPLLRARSCSVRSAPRDRRRARRAQNERARDARGARCGARGVRGRHGKSAFLCRGSRSARVLCLSLLSSLRAALLPRSPPRRRARASGHTTHARSESRVGVALRVCLWFVCASFRDLARRAARACALVWRKTGKSCFSPLVRRLAGLGGPWRPKKHTQTTTGLPYAAACFVKCVFSAVSKALSGTSTRRASAS